MLKLPILELKAEREELVSFFSNAFEQEAENQYVQQLFRNYVLQMGNRNVLDCFAVVKGRV